MGHRCSALHLSNMGSNVMGSKELPIWCNSLEREAQVCCLNLFVNLSTRPTLESPLDPISMSSLSAVLLLNVKESHCVLALAQKSGLSQISPWLKEGLTRNHLLSDGGTFR